jgi:LDH2 family malate/lactate/ureidoglycolate dehydrogenase
VPTIKPEPLADFVYRILKTVGATDDGAKLVANSLVDSNLAGHDSHGVIRLRRYLDSIARGEIHPTAEPVIARETGAITMVDARRGFGQLAAQFAVQVSVDKAQLHGLAATGLFNCNHIGRVGEWVQMAADQGLIGLAFCNGGRPGGLVTPYGGTARLLGTNPIAAAVPLEGRPPLVLDYATSIVSEGKVQVALNAGQAVPEGWILDQNGRPSTNPNDLYQGGMLLPAAGYKGYCLSLLLEFLGGILTGQGCPIFPDFTSVGNGVLFIVLSIEAFRPTADFLADGAAICNQVKMTSAAPNFAEVLLPGEPEQRSAEQRQAEGIQLDDRSWSELKAAAATLGVAIPDSGLLTS